MYTACIHINATSVIKTACPNQAQQPNTLENVIWLDIKPTYSLGWIENNQCLGVRCY